MSIQGLQNPFERLSVLPTTVNWRGTWVVSETYFKNDVTVSPNNGSSYILTGATSVNIGDDEPSTSALWSQFSNTSTGIESVNGIAPGITVDNTNPLQPIISNTGVLTITGGAAVFVDNTDPQNPIVNSSAIAALAPGNGIAIGGTPQVPTITNTGLLRIEPGLGIGVDTNTGNVTISNTGLISAVQGTGISVNNTDPQNPVISNAGVVALIAASGLSSSGGINPTISNTGVLRVAALDNTITVNNTDPQNPILSSEAPLLTLCSLSVDRSASFPPVLAGASGGLGFAGTPLSIFNQYVANGAPNPQGIFMVDLSPISLLFLKTAVTIQVTSTPYSVVYSDIATPGGPYTYTSLTFPSNYFLSLGQSYPIQSLLGQSYFNVADARATGMRVVTGIRIQNNTNATMVLATSGAIYAMYFPNGLE